MGSIISHIYDIIQLYGSYDNYLKDMKEKELANIAKQEPEPGFVDTEANEVNPD